MIRVYYSANIDAINWKIYLDSNNKTVLYFPSKTPASEVADKLCQASLFDEEDNDKIYVVNIDGWKLADKVTKQNIAELHNCDKQIIFAYEQATIRNKIFNELKIVTTKATSITKKSKLAVVSKLIKEAKLKLDDEAMEKLLSLLPDNINFIQNEILKLKLVNQTSFSKDEIQNIVFDLGDATVFNIVDSWLNKNESQTIERLNDLISKNITIQAFIPIFALKLVQLKFFLSAKLAHWATETITETLGLPFWQQNIYNSLRPYDKNLQSINEMLEKLYEFDINVKKQKNIPYTQLIKILFK